MYKIEIVRYYLHPDSEPCFRGSPLGNPVCIDDFNTRDKACDKFEKLFTEKVRVQDPTFMYELKRLNTKGIQQGYLKLGCFCGPSKRCHTETIKRFLENNYDLFLEHV